MYAIQTRSVAILILPAQIFGELEIRSFLLLGLARDGQKVRRFFDDNQSGILKMNFHSAAQHSLRRSIAVRPDLDTTSPGFKGWLNWVTIRPLTITAFVFQPMCAPAFSFPDGHAENE